MKGIWTMLFAFLVYVPLPAPCRAGDLEIIANDKMGVSAVSADELKRIFLVTKTSLEGTNQVEPVLIKAGPLHAAFLKEYIGRSADALLAYYRSLVFTGKGNLPESFNSEAEVIAYVAKTGGSIGYVSELTPTAGVKVWTSNNYLAMGPGRGQASRRPQVAAARLVLFWGDSL
ncbi:MAG: hypothetical protein ABSH56_28165 [Bryobacteraceae bacterium]|jgi:hypothetical protein